MMRAQLLDGVPYAVRRALPSDVPSIVALLADDDLGAGREQTLDLAPYARAFAAVERDPRQLLVVAHPAQDPLAVVATLQLTTIPGLSRHGALRGQLEAVRV